MDINSNLNERELLRALFLSNLKSPEERPFDNKYKARNILEKLIKYSN